MSFVTDIVVQRPDVAWGWPNCSSQRIAVMLRLSPACLPIIENIRALLRASGAICWNSMSLLFAPARF